MRFISSKTFLLLLIFGFTIFPQNNTWTKVTGALSDWSHPGFVYSPATGEYILTMGGQNQTGTNCVYSVQVFTHGLGKWINALPSPALYGVWADSTGYAVNNGRVGNAVFGTYYWAFKGVIYNGISYLRPNLGASFTPRAYNQFCLNPDDGKIYFYVNNATFSYDPATRLWDTIHVASHPNSGAVQHNLKWGSMVFDSLNHEIVLFGGGGVDNLKGTPETWTFNPATSTWTKLALAVQPEGRAHAPMAYDPATRKIVLFGGDHLDYLMNDTWVYDCATRTWEKKNPAVRPAPRAGHALLYMPRSGKIVLMGGYGYSWNQTNAFEMWKYDIAGNSWELIKRFATGDTWPKMAAMRPVLCGLSAVDRGDTVVAVADSAPTIYSFSGRAWRMACDPSVTDAAGTAAYGLTRDTVAVRGGWTEPSWFTAGVPAPDTAASEAALRALPIGTWTRITPPKTPQSEYRAWGTTILDPDRDQFLKWSGGHVAHCGTDVPHYSISQNRWTIGYVPEWPLEYNGYNSPDPGPFTFNGRPFMPCHTVKSYAYDVRSRKMIFTYIYHTYVYDPDRMDWEKHDIHTSFGGSGYGTGLVSTPHGAVCVGNNAPGLAHPSTSRVFLWEPDSLNWRALPLSGVTMDGFWADVAGVVYDEKRDRVLLTVGRGGGASARLFSYDFATGTATRLMPADSVLARSSGNYYRECAYLPKLDAVIFQARVDSSNLIYDCANDRWAKMAVKGFVGTMEDRGTGFMYDKKRNLLWNSDHYCANYAIRLDSALSRAELDRSAREISGLTVSPNPFSPATLLLLPRNLKGAASLKIFGADGRLVADLSDRISGGRVFLRTEKLAAGIYAIRLSAAGKSWQTRAVRIK